MTDLNVWLVEHDAVSPECSFSELVVWKFVDHFEVDCAGCGFPFEDLERH